MELWYPRAIRVPGNSAGGHVPGAGPSITHHTTEGGSAQGAIGAYRANNSWPHFTAGWEDGRLAVYQHLPLDAAARSLKNPPDQWETNRAGTTQIEHVGFAGEAGRWPAERYEAIAQLCRWIELQTGCPRQRMPGTVWGVSSPPRLSGRDFHHGRGHVGHMHAPGNDHQDPGGGFKISLVLAGGGDVEPFRALRDGDTGPDVLELQRAVRMRASRCGRPDLMPTADGVYGPETARCAATVAYILGVGVSAKLAARRALSVTTQQRVRWPQKRNAIQVRRAAARRTKHCREADE